jgi:hypothetical protein
LKTGHPAGNLAGVRDHGRADGVVRLRERADGDSAWYAASVRDPLIQRFTSESPALDAELAGAGGDRQAAGGR